MERLIAESRQAGFWKLVSRDANGAERATKRERSVVSQAGCRGPRRSNKVENTASRALLQRLGFREVGIYERHGMLRGTWRATVIVERLLS